MTTLLILFIQKKSRSPGASFGILIRVAHDRLLRLTLTDQHFAYIRQPDDSQTSRIYVGNSITKLQIQVAAYVFELSAGNCHL
jgi:hypothetical protein